MEFGDYRSKEEVYFSWWLDELKREGYVKEYRYESRTLTLMNEVKLPWTKQMKTKNKVEEHHLFSATTYTPDFEIIWTEKAFGVFCDGVPCVERPYFMATDHNNLLTEGITLVDVKGDHSAGASRGNFSQYSFPYKQKMAWMTLGLYVQKVVPVKLFRETFVPKRYFMTDGGGQARKLTSLTNPKAKGKRKKGKDSPKPKVYKAKTFNEFIKGVGPIQQNLLP